MMHISLNNTKQKSVIVAFYDINFVDMNNLVFIISSILSTFSSVYMITSQMICPHEDVKS